MTVAKLHSRAELAPARRSAPGELANPRDGRENVLCFLDVGQSSPLPGTIIMPDAGEKERRAHPPVVS